MSDHLINVGEVELPDTIFIRDIEDKVFQSVVVQCLLDIEGIALVEGNLIDYFLGRNPAERITGISVEQDLKTHSIQVKVEVNVAFGIIIPKKAEEIQVKISEELSRLTGLHVQLVHVVFKNLITKAAPVKEEISQEAPAAVTQYSENF